MIRLATEADYETVSRFVEELVIETPYQRMMSGFKLTPEIFSYYISNPNKALILLFLNPEPVGFVAFDFQESYGVSNAGVARMTYIYLEKEHRGQDLMKDAKTAFEHWGKQVGAKFYCVGHKMSGYKKLEEIYMKEVK